MKKLGPTTLGFALLVLALALFTGGVLLTDCSPRVYGATHDLKTDRPEMFQTAFRAAVAASGVQAQMHWVVVPNEGAWCRCALWSDDEATAAANAKSFEHALVAQLSHFMPQERWSEATWRISKVPSVFVREAAFAMTAVGTLVGAPGLILLLVGWRSSAASKTPMLPAQRKKARFDY